LTCSACASVPARDPSSNHEGRPRKRDRPSAVKLLPLNLGGGPRLVVRGTCPPVRIRAGHVPRPAGSTKGHVQPRLRGLDITPLCPPDRPTGGHVPGRQATRRDMSSAQEQRGTCPGPARSTKGHVQCSGAARGMSRATSRAPVQPSPNRPPAWSQPSVASALPGPSVPAAVRRRSFWLLRLRA
jgi:hypothetical protein